jgi:serine/threonine-protein kinase
MGLVYHAVHEALRKPVALKVLGTAGRNDREAMARFEREAIAAANLKHPNIAEAADFGQLPNGGLYIVMEYVEGTTLRRLVAEQGKLAPDRALAILQQVAAALATAHARDVVHRDLKPDNVIVTRPPESIGQAAEVVKVIDFGVAKLRSATFGGGGTGLTGVGTVFGTPTYMSPEQVMGQVVDSRADQYALGVLAFELLTGKPPYHADDVGQLMMMHVGAPVPSTCEQAPGLPTTVDAVTARMLAKLPDERFASVAEAIQALTTALSASAAAPLAVPPQPSSIREQPAPVAPPLMAPAPTANATRAPTLVSSSTDQGARSAGPHKGRVIVFAVALSALLVGGVLAVVLVRSHGEQPAEQRAEQPAEQPALPPELAAALVDWKNGKFETAGAAIGKAVAASAPLAELDAVSKPLAASVADESARRALGHLFETTTLGGSRAMASALADVAVADEPKGRDGALRFLHGRSGLLSAEQAARVHLRDAESCATLEAAKAEETQVATAATERDLDRIHSGECKTLLRVSQLCDACTANSVPGSDKGQRAISTLPAAPVAAPAPAAPGRGKAKGHGKR